MIIDRRVAVQPQLFGHAPARHGSQFCRLPLLNGLQQRAQEGHGVDDVAGIARCRFASVLQSQVQMVGRVAKDVAGVVGQAQHLPCLHRLAHLHVQFFEMRVDGLVAAGMQHTHMDAVGMVVGCIRPAGVLTILTRPGATQ